MKEPFWVLALCWVVFAGQAYLMVRFAERYVRPLQGQEPFGPTDDRILGTLAAITGFVGLWHFSHGATLFGLVLLAAVCTTLDFACCSDLRAGRVPALLAIPVALAIGAIDAAGHDWSYVFAGLIIMFPFALFAAASRGKSAGYGDVALIGLGGFALGLERGILTTAIACFAAAGIAMARRRGAEALPFAPYLAIAVQGALFLPKFS